MKLLSKLFAKKQRAHLLIFSLFFILLVLPISLYLANKEEKESLRSDAATSLLSGFTETQVVSGLNQPTAMAFSPDGRLFVLEKAGRVRVIKNGSLLPTPFVDITAAVDDNGERGLLGIAFDPNFSTNNFVYLNYTAGSPSIHHRVSRFTANGDIAVSGSETAILDSDGTGGNVNHNGGAIHFGLDGKLYIATGDNRTPSNAQSLNNRLGKILRINKDGTIPTDNPTSFTLANGTTASTTGANRAIWAIGFRNPFTFAIDPVDGRMYVNDVGEGTMEEVSHVQVGRNYGWPECEGTSGTCNKAQYTAPIHAYGRSVGASIAGGAFYRGNHLPAEYQGDYFFGDYVSNWIKILEIGTNSKTDFATGASSHVDVKIGPDGLIYWLSIGNGAVYRIQRGAPNAVASGNPTSGNAPLTVNFSGTGSTDPNGSTLTYTWDFGDGQTGNGINVSHTYNNNGLYDAVLTVRNTSNQTDISDPVTINVGNVNLLTGHWKFDAGTGTTTIDSSGSNNTGTITGATWTTGKFGGGLSFDGGDFVQVPDSTSLDLTTKGTVTGWFKRSAINNWHALVAKGNVNDPNSHNYGCEFNTGNELECTISSGGSNQVIVSTPITDTTNFHHFALVWNGSTINLYIDGQLNKSSGQTITPSANSSPLYFGQWGGNTDRFVGVIDDVRVYKQALTTQEVFGLFTGGTGNQSPVGTISTPTTGTLYTAGNTINYSGNATDSEDGTLAASAFSWTIVFHHDTHTHPYLGPITNTKTGTFPISKTNEPSANVFYRINLTVTDSANSTHTSFVDVVPRKSTITLATIPVGLQINLDSQPKSTPHSVEGVVGFTRQLEGISPQTLNGKTYEFVSWSDNGTVSHSIDTPTSNTTYTATYREVPTNTPVPTTGTGKTGDLNGDNQVGITDLSILLSNWNTTNAVADINRDGTVGILDLSIMLSNWGL